MQDIGLYKVKDPDDSTAASNRFVMQEESRNGDSKFFRADSEQEGPQIQSSPKDIMKGNFETIGVTEDAVALYMSKSGPSLKVKRP